MQINASVYFFNLSIENRCAYVVYRIFAAISNSFWHERAFFVTAYSFQLTQTIYRWHYIKNRFKFLDVCISSFAKFSGLCVCVCAAVSAIHPWNVNDMHRRHVFCIIFLKYGMNSSEDKTLQLVSIFWSEQNDRMYLKVIKKHPILRWKK